MGNRKPPGGVVPAKRRDQPRGHGVFATSRMNQPEEWTRSLPAAVPNGISPEGARELKTNKRRNQ